MKIVKFFVFLFVAALCNKALSATLVLEGTYQYKNIYVQNGFGGNGVGFCAFEVRVNGHTTTDEVNSTAFEVDLTPFKFNLDDKVIIEIDYKDGCVPKILNPEALKPKPSFEIVSIEVDKEGRLIWKTKNEAGKIPFIIEQFKWNKWVYVGEVMGEGLPKENTYSFVVHTHSGENKFRVKQVGFASLPRTSKPVVVSTLMDAPSFKFENSLVNFSDPTAYEVYDYYGNVVKKGFGNELNIANLIKGKYYMCYDNKVTEIEKKK
jgi:hypothetical protein